MISAGSSCLNYYTGYIADEWLIDWNLFEEPVNFGGLLVWSYWGIEFEHPRPIKGLMNMMICVGMELGIYGGYY